MVMDSRSRRPLQRAMGAAEVNRIYVTEFCYITRETPDVAAGHPDVAIFIGKRPDDSQRRPVFKFSKQLPEKGPSDIENAIITMGDLITGLQWTRNNKAKEFDFRFVIHAIREDFDPSTLTYNQYTALDTTNEGSVGRVYLPAAGGTGSDSGDFWEGVPAQPQGQGLVMSASVIKKLLDPAEGTPAYGFSIWGDTSGPDAGSTSTMTWRVDRDLLKTGTEKYSTWIDWF